MLGGGGGKGCVCVSEGMRFWTSGIDSVGLVGCSDD